MVTHQREIEKTDLLNAFDEPIRKIATFAASDLEVSQETLHTASLCLLDALSCGIKALDFKEALKNLGPFFKGDSSAYGARIPGTKFQVTPLIAAFQIGSLIRWLDYNDTFLAKEWGHPSDNLGAILAIADHLSLLKSVEGKDPPLMIDVIKAQIKAYEIQGMLALENCFNQKGFDHVILVKVASSASAAYLMGADSLQIASAVSNAFADAGPLRCYRHFPNAGPRKSWAAGDASSRGLFFAAMAMRGELGIKTPLSANRWGLSDVILGGDGLKLSGTLHSYVMDNILFKVLYPAEFHAQTAVEAAVRLHPKVKGRLGHIERIELETQSAGLHIIDKKGPLKNYADRDHCLQYMVAVALIKGHIDPEDYGDEAALDPRIDTLRDLMTVKENERFSQEYHESDKRSIANSVKIIFKEGTSLKEEFDYPIGHKKRRSEAMPHLLKKIRDNLKGRLGKERTEHILALLHDQKRFFETPVHVFIDSLCGVLDKDNFPADKIKKY